MNGRKLRVVMVTIIFLCAIAAAVLYGQNRANQLHREAEEVRRDAEATKCVVEKLGEAVQGDFLKFNPALEIVDVNVPITMEFGDTLRRRMFQYLEVSSVVRKNNLHPHSGYEVSSSILGGHRVFPNKELCAIMKNQEVTLQRRFVSMAFEPRERERMLSEYNRALDAWAHEHPLTYVSYADQIAIWRRGR